MNSPRPRFSYGSTAFFALDTERIRRYRPGLLNTQHLSRKKRMQRRLFSLALGSGLATMAAGVSAKNSKGQGAHDVEAQLRQIEAASGGRLGVCILNTADGRRLGHRADERFAARRLRVGALHAQAMRRQVFGVAGGNQAAARLALGPVEGDAKAGAAGAAVHAGFRGAHRSHALMAWAATGAPAAPGARAAAPSAGASAPVPRPAPRADWARRRAPR